MEELNIPESQPHRSLILPLTLVLVGVVLGSAFLYLNTTYPELFKKSLETAYNTIVPPGRQAASDEQTTTAEPQIANITAPTPAPTRSPYPLIPDKGSAGTYKVSHNAGSGPTITNIEIDPLDAKQGDNVKISITTTHTTPITSISSQIKTDQDPINLTFRPKSNTDNTQVWETEFQLTRQISYTYIYHFDLSDGTHQSSLDMALRN